VKGGSGVIGPTVRIRLGLSGGLRMFQESKTWKDKPTYEIIERDN
jgi:hypothetical protein